MQVFLKFPENPEKYNDETTFIILEFQGKIDSTQEDLDGMELGNLSQLTEQVFSFIMVLIFSKYYFKDL